jgi:hypothetical protein
MSMMPDDQTTDSLIKQISSAKSAFDEAVEAVVPDTMFNLSVRRLKLVDDAARVLRFRQAIFNDLPDRDLVLPEDDEEGWARDHLGDQGITIGVFDGDTLVGYASMLIPDIDHPEHLGQLIGFRADELRESFNLASCMVLPSHRGYGIQRRTVALRFGIASHLGRHVALSLTSVRNFPSRHNLMKSGLSVVWAGELEPARRRMVFRRDLRVDADAFHYADVKAVYASDFERHVELTSRGYVGFREALLNDKLAILFAKPKEIAQ